MRICELKQKEVINMKDCRRLGFISDLEFDCRSGCITEIIVPGTGKICGIFGRDTEYRIPFCRVCQIGPDIVLVDINDKEVPVQECAKG